MSLLFTLPFAAVFLLIPGTIMRAIFAHGAFDSSAASLAAIGLAAYGVGLPAFALVRIMASTFYARHDTMTPARATLTAFGANLALKVVLVWGLHLGIAGIALGTAFGAWLNVGQLVWTGRRRGLLVVDAHFRRAIVPVLLAAVGAGAGAWLGVHAAAHVPVGHALRDVVNLAAGAALGGALYIGIVLAFRRALPLGRLAGRAG
jgi:putative peptidoglycan lipid II flippase